MTVGKVFWACWIVFAVMCLAFLPVRAGILAIHALPGGLRAVLAVVVAGGLWWAPFVYGMYLGHVVMKNGDPRLLRRGVAGTATVLSNRAAGMSFGGTEDGWGASTVHKYRLRVSLPGRAPYETSCTICTSGIHEGSTVRVMASRRNRKRVTIDYGQGRKGGAAVHTPRTQVQDTAAVRAAHTVDDRAEDSVPVHRAEDTTRSSAKDSVSDPGQSPQGEASSATGQRLAELAKLGQLHQQGILTDAEFAAEKARLPGT